MDMALTKSNEKKLDNLTMMRVEANGASQFDAVGLADSCGGAVGWSLAASIDRVPS
jgi:hypothetical protein